MPLKILVKAGSITNLSDARYCAGMGVDFLGFQVIEGQPNALSAKAFQEIRGWVTGPQIVAEIYGITDVSQLTSIMEDFRPDYFELGLTELQAVGHSLTIPYMLILNEDQVLPMFSTPPAYVITSYDSSSLSRFIPGYDLLLTVKNLDELNLALEHTGVSGICINGGSEIRPGLKHYDELADILEALDVD